MFSVLVCLFTHLLTNTDFVCRVHATTFTTTTPHSAIGSPGFPPPLVARPVASLAELMCKFEQLRIFSDYRTPVTLRAFCRLCCFILSGVPPSLCHFVQFRVLFFPPLMRRLWLGAGVVPSLHTDAHLSCQCAWPPTLRILSTRTGRCWGTAPR